MSRGPWRTHDVHCPNCGHYARMVGKRPTGIKRYQCANRDCRHTFVLDPGESSPQPVAAQPEPKGPYAVAGRIVVGRGLNWQA